jgi:hypothetical protein
MHMMLTITRGDFLQLSEPCQRELLALMGFMTAPEASDDESIPYEDGGGYQADPRFTNAELGDGQVSPLSSKRVVDVTQGQAMELISNISDKSIETLKLFATGRSIALDELIGEHRPYANMTDLKRSFVGAVNRRLRTVTGNRRAVLFLTVKPESSEDSTQISVRTVTAESLSHALSLRS